MAPRRRAPAGLFQGVSGGELPSLKISIGFCVLGPDSFDILFIHTVSAAEKT